MVWKKTIATDHTEGEPPSRGSTMRGEHRLHGEEQERAREHGRHEHREEQG
jgi:hypothetical protein